MTKRLATVLAAVLLLAKMTIPVCFASTGQAAGQWYCIPLANEEITLPSGHQVQKVAEKTGWKVPFHGSRLCLPPASGLDCAVATDRGTVSLTDSGFSLYMATLRFSSVTVDGKTGSMEMHVHGYRSSPTVDWQGRWIITHADGELVGLEGQGSWWGPGWRRRPLEYGEFRYEGQYRFELPNSFKSQRAS